MSTPSIKTIYEFPVETLKPDGTKVTTLFAFKRPSRVERENADEWRAKWWNTYLENGLMPEALLLKKYDNGGGIYTDAQKAEMETLLARLREIEKGRADAQIAKDEATLKGLDVELVQLRERFATLYRIKESFLQNTAEAKAVQRLTEWLVLYLSYSRPDASSPWVPFFKGASEEEKYASLDSMEDDLLYQKSISNLNAVAELFVATGGNLKPEDLVLASAVPVAPPASVTPPASDAPAQSNVAP